MQDENILLMQNTLYLFTKDPKIASYIEKEKKPKNIYLLMIH